MKIMPPHQPSEVSESPIGMPVCSPIVFLDDNEIFVRYVRAVGIAARAEVIGLSDPRRLDAVLEMHQPRTVITDLHMPFYDAIELLPLLKSTGSVTRLVIVSGTRSPFLTAAAHLARAGHSWTVETWTKPLRTAFLRQRLEAFSRHPGPSSHRVGY